METANESKLRESTKFFLALVRIMATIILYQEAYISREKAIETLSDVLDGIYGT